MEQLPSLFKTLGHLTGNTERAHKAASTFDSQLIKLKADYADKREVSAFYQIWDEPIMTFNGDHLVSDIIDLCGGRNVFAGELPLVPHVNIEAVIDANPEVILSSGSEERMANWRSKWRRWSAIDAVKKNHLYLVPPDLLQRQSNRILEGAIYLCEFIDQAR
jgi:iron complex transport system substrate-binding protein